MSKKYTIGVVGNPNCGKTTLFNALTGAKQRVGNWPGVTVERKTGHYIYQEDRFELVDLPGTYSLEVSAEEVSIDEQIARDYVAENAADLIVNIVDGSNLERNLYLTSQLIEMDVPLLVAVNMMDMARERGLEIDIAGLAGQLGCPVVEVVAARGEGVAELKAAIAEAAETKNRSGMRIDYGGIIEASLDELLPHVEQAAIDNSLNPRWLAVPGFLNTAAFVAFNNFPSQFEEGVDFQQGMEGLLTNRPDFIPLALM